MKTLNALIKTNESITAVIYGVPQTMSHEHPSFAEALICLTTGDIDTLDKLFDISATIQKKFTHDGVGNLTIQDGCIFYKGTEIHNYVTDRIFEFMEEGLPFRPLVNFLDKLMQNPSRRSVIELYKFLEHKSMPICEDGDFLAYKSVDENYRDHYSKKFDNSVGQILEMPRNNVCDDATHGCAEGFHAGTYEYASSFGRSGTSNLLIVKIDPSDVVSVPKDCDCQKLRTARYEVVKDFERIYRQPLNTEFGESNYDEDGYDEDDYDDEDKDTHCGDEDCNYHNHRDSRGRFMKKQ